MPVTEWNLNVWNDNYDWSQQGEEWSETWGGSEAQWFAVIYPRIHTYLPAGSILEIAPGFGRWTSYLRHCCEQLTIVDLAPQCIEACKQRFSKDSHITYHVNDGSSLAMVPDKSIDFVFSFDSLVHVESDVIETYLAQLAKKLKPNGIGFIHHSNIGEYPASAFSPSKRMPEQIKKFLKQKGYYDNSHMRAFSMTASRFENLCQKTGLQCTSQEIVNWGTKRLIDCLSVFTLSGSDRSRVNRVVRNPDFMAEADLAKRIAPLYMSRDARGA
jgi:2-polyprenyl-3-methyl-5-hydroxy-6-metoxy-1,4-benzoquinol methylase